MLQSDYTGYTSGHRIVLGYPGAIKHQSLLYKKAVKHKLKVFISFEIN